MKRPLRRTLVRSGILFGYNKVQLLQGKYRLLFVLSLFTFHFSLSQRIEISLNNNWRTIADEKSQDAFNGFEATNFNDRSWKKVDVPHNWDQYEGYRRMRHGNKHGYAWYRKTFAVKQQPANKRFFLFFEGVGSYATVWLNGKKVGYHAGGRTTFTLDVTTAIKQNAQNVLAVRADHPANIKDLPWVCGGCSDERGISEGSQPMGIFRPVHLIVTNDVRIEPFGVHVWNDTTVSNKSAKLYYQTEIKNYSGKKRKLFLTTLVVDAKGKTVNEISHPLNIESNAGISMYQSPTELLSPSLWSLENPYLYTVVTKIFENNKLIDEVRTPYGIRWISWPIRKSKSSNQFLLNGKPVFINGIAEYEHLLGGSHAFSEEQIRTRVMEIKEAGFNAFRDAHHPHNLRYQHYWDSLGVLWWTQMSAHVWYDSKEFRENFKSTLREWVKERRNSPSLVLWGLQNESKLPKDFAEECSQIIREMDPTASSQRLITTCNGGEGTDWDVPQNWTGTYGGNPDTYGEDLKKQILVGEYGAWRTLDLHTEGNFNQNGPLSEDRMTQLMEKKIRLAESVKDSVAGHFMWLLTSHDNPGRVQGGEGYRELDRIGPVNYKGLLTPWEEPTDAYYMYRSNYADKNKEPMVYIASHTWPDRWIKPGKKAGIVVYSNCDEVELFNDINSSSLGKRKKGGKGTHFEWNDVDIKYNVLYAVGYVNGKQVAEDVIVLQNLLQAPHFISLYKNSKNSTSPQPGHHYLYRMNCGGPAYEDVNGNNWLPDRERTTSLEAGSVSWTNDFANMPPYFASQRRTFDPICGTKDWDLFQTFRYGRDKLQYDFPVPDGDYLVELYFTEPWWGRGGNINCKGWRLFDVAINNKVVLKNLDIWQEAGYSTVLKKTINVKVTGGHLTISFPKIISGQAVISAIAIATKNAKASPALSAQPLARLLFDSTTGREKIQDWLDIGDETYVAAPQQNKIVFQSVPPEVYGAQWIKDYYNRKGIEPFELLQDADVFIAVDSSTTKENWAKGFDELKSKLELSNGNIFRVFKKRMKKGEQFNLQMEGRSIAIFQPASNIEPAYDLKPLTTYKAINAKWSGAGMIKGQIDGKDRIIFQSAADDNEIEWNFTVGVADVYSLTVSYNNPVQQTVNGKLQLFASDGSMMREEDVEFTPTKQGKSNYISTTTGSMINAGTYKLRLTSRTANGLSINALDVQ